MGNCQEVRRQDNYDDDNTISAPDNKQSKRERTQNETSMKFMSQTADDDQFQFGGGGDEFHRILEMPKKMIRKPAPKFESNMYFESVKKVSLDDFAGKYLVLFFYPYDFNKMFQEEILDFSENTEKFKKLNCELLGCSIDSHYSHMSYCTKPRSEGGLGPIKFPLMADVDRKIVTDYGVLINNGNEAGTCLRSTFIIDDKQIVRHLAINDYAGHLKADEILRLVQAIQEGDKANAKAASTKGSSSIKVGSGKPEPKTLYDRIGGEEAVTAAVGIFYKKMLADSKVAHFFKSTDMTKQHSQQISFLCFALGGPKKYVGKNMRDAHQYLRLTNVEFDATVGHLVSTLKDLNVDEALIGEIGKLVEPLRKDIVFTQSTSIFEQLGGEKALETAVEIFYTKVIEDTRLAPFFKSIDMARQKGMMRSFLTMALGGSKDYSGRNMKEAHKNLGITDTIFDVTVGHLTATLQQLKVDEKILKQIGGFIQPLRKEIVSAEEKPPQMSAGSADVLPRKETNKTESTPTSASAKSKKYLVDRIGGPAKIEQLVGVLLDRVYKDKRINSFFATIEQQKMKGVLCSFLVQFTGGEKGYKGKNLREAHANLKVNDVQFNIFVTHLRDSLASMKVEISVFHEFCNMFESFRGHVVTVKLSIFDRLGGDAAIANISEKFYSKVAADPRIKDLFTTTDLTRLKEMQSNFLTQATGGGKKNPVKNMKDAHAAIPINDIQFNAFKENLQLTLKELLVDPQTFQEISALIETQRSSIVNVKLPLLDRMGGDTGILAVVNRFYDRVLLDPRIQKLFAGVDMKRLRGMQHSFLLFAVKGSPPYSGKNMKEAHARLALNDTHFNLIKDHLIQSMRDCSKDPLSLVEVGNVVEGLRNDIVSVKLPLVERIGGDIVMKKAVERFYSKALQDPRMKEMFKHVDMNNLKISQNNFLTMLMGGPNNYKGKSMKEAHAALKINDQMFNAFKEYIVQSFRELGIDNITIGEIAKAVEINRNDVVSVHQTMYERIGGEAQMDILIPKFYLKLVANPSIGSMFASIDGTKQKKMLKQFFTTVLGGKQEYTGKNLTKAHEHIKITDAMFAEFRMCMEQTLKEMGANQLLIGDMSKVIEHFKKAIVR